MKRKKALRRLNKMRKTGIKAWKKKRSGKWQMVCALFFVPVFCVSSFREQDNWQEICIRKETFIKKEWIQEQYILEKNKRSKDTEETKVSDPVLNEGAALFLKEGKLLFFRIREEEKTQDPTD